MAQDTLLPAGSMLFAPSGKLLPPSEAGMLVGNGPASGQELAALIDRARADARQLASRASAEAKVLADRAAEIATEKMPEIRRQFGKLADSAKVTLADRDQRNAFATVDKRRLGIAAGALVILAGGGYAFVKHQAPLAARARVDGFLARTALSSNISYTDISASPFGSMTMSDVTVKVAGQKDIARISALKVSASRPTAMRSLPPGRPPTASRFQSWPWHASVPVNVEAVGLGYTALQGDIFIAGHFDNRRRTFSFSARGEVSGLGSIDANFKFGDLDSSLVMTLAALSQTGRRFNGIDAMTGGLAGLQSLTQVTLAEADVSIDNSGYIRRSREITSDAIPPDEVAAAPAAGPIDETKLVRLGMAPSDARAANEAAKAWGPGEARCVWPPISVPPSPSSGRMACSEGWVLCLTVSRNSSSSRRQNL